MTKFMMPTVSSNEDSVEKRLRSFAKRRGFSDEVAECEILERRARLQRQKLQ